MLPQKLKKKGVLTEVSERRNLNGKTAFNNENGKILLLKGQLEDMALTVVGNYTPQKDKEVF